MRQRLAFVMLPGLVALWAGCGGNDGPPLYPVTGVVKYKGEQKGNVEVTFVPKEGDGIPALGSASEDGFVVMMTNGREGVAEGHYDVAIGEPIRPMTEQALKTRSPPPMSFPGKYSVASMSGLEFTVKPTEEEQTFEFVLKDE